MLKNVILFLLLFSVNTLFADIDSGCSPSDSSQVCTSYTNEYNILTCSCQAKSFAPPMTIFGNIDSHYDLQGGKVFFYDNSGTLLSEGYIGENNQFGTNIAFGNKKIVSLGDFSGEGNIKISYGVIQGNIEKIGVSSEYSCDERFIFQSNTLCEYVLSPEQSFQPIFSQGGGYSSQKSSSNYSTQRLDISDTTKPEEPPLQDQKFVNIYENVAQKFGELEENYEKEQNNEIRNLRLLVLERIKNILITRQNGGNISQEDVQQLQNIFSKYLTQLQIPNTYISDNSQVQAVGDKIDEYIMRYTQGSNKEITTLRNSLVQDFELYILKNDVELRDIIIQKLTALQELLKDSKN
ncbi:hypothetical protein N9J72_00500 [Candidatus Gracilibacteria bacterium]|nr:hypothetical protein [Candidatus Gracilibacteria bacterium]